MALLWRGSCCRDADGTAPRGATSLPTRSEPTVFLTVWSRPGAVGNQLEPTPSRSRRASAGSSTPNGRIRPSLHRAPGRPGAAAYVSLALSLGPTDSTAHRQRSAVLGGRRPTNARSAACWAASRAPESCPPRDGGQQIVSYEDSPPASFRLLTPRVDAASFTVVGLRPTPGTFLPERAWCGPCYLGRATRSTACTTMTRRRSTRSFFDDGTPIPNRCGKPAFAGTARVRRTHRA